MAEAGEAAKSLEILVSIINFRTPDMTIACASSVLDDFGPLHGHVAIVDNCSDDGSADAIADWIATLGPGAPVSLVRSATNAGYAGGHNQGVGLRAAEASMILNSDALLRPGTLAALLGALRADPGLGMVAPRLEDPDGTPQISAFRFPSPMSELIRGAQLGVVTRALKRWDTPLPVDPRPEDLGWVSGCCILKRREMIEAIGPMDEGYFMYFEDAEYCLRAGRAGWRIALIPQARVMHLRGGSAPVKKLNAARKPLPAYYYASRTRFLRQASGWLGPLGGNAAYLLGRGLNLVRFLIGDPPNRVAREPRDVWINFLDPLGDRRAPGA